MDHERTTHPEQPSVTEQSLLRSISDAEHAVTIAGAIVDYVSARDVRYADKPQAMKRAFDNLVGAIGHALKSKRSKDSSVTVPPDDTDANPS